MSLPADLRQKLLGLELQGAICRRILFGAKGRCALEFGFLQ
jgi:hypothetical protein